MKDFEGENENINQEEKGIYKISCYQRELIYILNE